MIKQYLEAGEFVTTHGIAGELRLYPFSDDNAFLQRFSVFYLSADGKKQVKVLAVRPHKNICIVALEGVTSIAEARQYIGKTVWIDRADAQLPPGRVFVQDLLGARVLDADTGREYGRITAVTKPGRHDVYEVTDEADRQHLFPATEPFLVEVQPGEGLVRVRPIPGMFEDADATEVPGDGGKTAGEEEV